MDPKPAASAPQRFSPRIWALAKADYLKGVSGRVIQEELGINRKTLHKRAQREGWTRKLVWAQEAAEMAGEPAPSMPADPAATPIDVPFVQPSPARIVEVSLMRAMEALQRGNAAEATRLVEAGGKVGEFAELVKLVRAREGLAGAAVRCAT